MLDVSRSEVRPLFLDVSFADLLDVSFEDLLDVSFEDLLDVSFEDLVRFTRDFICISRS